MFSAQNAQSVGAAALSRALIVSRCCALWLTHDSVRAPADQAKASSAIVRDRLHLTRAEGAARRSHVVLLVVIDVNTSGLHGGSHFENAQEANAATNST